MRTILTAWHVQPIFLASTFDDMQWERDHLRRVVIPDVQSRLRAKGYRVSIELIDLRWGLDTTSESEAQAKQLQIMRVCLQEVRRSRPFLIGLLGDRYGWVPPEETLRHFASDAGIAGNVAGRSVTELELTSGALYDAGHTTRALVYLRRLDHLGMRATDVEFFSDERGGRPAQAQKLEALKQRLTQALGAARVKPYEVAWDSDRDGPRGDDVSRWGLQVANDLESQIEEELRARAEAEPSGAAVGSPRQLEERWAIEQFFEDAARGFSGRENTVAELASHLLAASDPDSVCVVGPAGSGKSALLAKVVAGVRPALSSASLLLAATDATPLTRTPLALLRGFAAELAETSGEPGVADNELDLQRVKSVFARLLERVSAARRVVIVIDGLDKLEGTASKVMNWLPDPLPPGVRLLASSVSGDATAAFAQRTSATIVNAGRISLGDAGSIAAAICRRYGASRTMNPAIMRALAPTDRPAADPPWSHVLWLTTAVEELNQLDADDYRLARKDGARSPEEALLNLLLEVAAGFPSTVEDLLARMRERAEDICSRAWTSPILHAIATSRTGLRLQELTVVATAAGETWDDLRFAQLRRVLGSHLVQRAAGQWTFASAIARTALSPGSALGDDVRRLVDRALAEYFFNLPADDPLRPHEVLERIRAADARQLAVRYLGTNLDPIALSEAADTLTHPTQAAVANLLWAIRSIAGDTADHVRAPLPAQLALILHRARITDAISAELYVQLMAPLVNGVLAAARNRPDDRLLAVGFADLVIEFGRAFSGAGEMDAARSQFEQALSLFEDLMRAAPKDTTIIRSAVRAIDGLADLVADAATEGSLRERGLTLTRRAFELDPSDVQAARDVGSSLNLLARMHLAAGRTAAAAEAAREASALIERAVEAAPGNTDFISGAIHAREGEGDALLGQQRYEEAAAAFEATLPLCDRLLESNPRLPKWRLRKAVVLRSLGEALVRLGRSDAAERRFDESARIRFSLYDEAPESSEHGLAAANITDQIGDIMLRTHRAHAAIETFKEGLEIRDQLLRREPDSFPARLGRTASLEALGTASRAIGKSYEGLAFLTESLTSRRALWKQAPRRQTTLALARALVHVGDASNELGDVPGAMAAYEEGLELLEPLSAGDAKAGELKELKDAAGERLAALRSGNPQRFPTVGQVVISLGKASASTNQLIAKAQPLLEAGDAAAGRGDQRAALEAYEGAIAVVRDETPDPAPVQLQFFLSKLLFRAAGIWRDAGHLAEARARYREATDCCRAAVAVQHHPVLLEGLCQRLKRLRETATAMGDLGEAASAAEEEPRRRRELVELQKGDDRSLHALLVSCFECGLVLARAGRDADAAALFDEADATYARVKQSIGTGTLADAGALFSVWADCLIGAQDLPRAVRVLELGLTEMRNQSEIQHRDRASRLSLVSLVHRLGVAHHMSGDLKGARAASGEASTLVNELMQEGQTPDVMVAANAVAMLVSQTG